ncbi:TRAP transporter small permease subunit [Desulfatibacillum aliphaticivorans]|uniref:TRAP transporter small permease subunit n=1 Tax=Desulfatibacillum aliphaticivorans TaxID=218208 RepID=UPI0003FE6696|nr:TRAP transporter small permease subunit [Desulfatibacillum aliphaticivorans]
MEWSNKWAPRFNEILPAGLLIIFGVAVMTAVLVYSICSMQVRQAETGLNFAVQNAAERISDWIEGHLGELGLVAADQTFIALSEGGDPNEQAVQEVSNSLQAVTKDIKEYRAAMLLNKAGEIVAAGDDKTDMTVNLAGDQDFQKALEGKPVVSNVFQSGRYPVFYLMQPVYKERDKRGKVDQTPENTVGVLAVTVDMNKLVKRFIKGLRSGEEGQAYMINSTGLVIGSTEKDAILEVNVNDLGYGSLFLADRNGLTAFAANEAPMAAAFHTVGDWGWKLVVEQNSDDLYERAQGTRRDILLAGVVLAVFLFFAVWYIINKEASVECMANIHKSMIYVEKIALIILLFTMIFMQFGQVIARNIFQTGIMWVDEVLRVEVLWVAFLGAGLAAEYNRHIKIDVLSHLLGDSKASKTLDVFAQVFALIACALLFNAAVTYIESEAKYPAFTLVDTDFLKVPDHFFRLVIPYFFLVMSVRCIINIRRIILGGYTRTIEP